MAITLVNSWYFEHAGTSSCSPNLNNEATPGNLLVYVNSIWKKGVDITGHTISGCLTSNFSRAGGSSDYNSVIAGIRVATGNSSDNITIGSSPSFDISRTVVYEFNLELIGNLVDIADIADNYDSVGEFAAYGTTTGGFSSRDGHIEVVIQTVHTSSYAAGAPTLISNVNGWTYLYENQEEVFGSTYYAKWSTAYKISPSGAYTTSNMDTWSAMAYNMNNLVIKVSGNALGVSGLGMLVGISF